MNKADLLIDEQVLREVVRDTVKKELGEGLEEMANATIGCAVAFSMSKYIFPQYPKPYVITSAVSKFKIFEIKLLIEMWEEALQESEKGEPIAHYLYFLAARINKKRRDNINENSNN